jgi:hypothetical protein
MSILAAGPQMPEDLSDEAKLTQLVSKGASAEQPACQARSGWNGRDRTLDPTLAV